ncbi:MAG: hypothetical protein V4439_02835 [Patescibacteria group bacterium]
MSINIKNVKGDIIASEKQTGGFTGKATNCYNFFDKNKKSMIISTLLFIVALIAFFSNLTTILNYFKIIIF